MDKYSKSAFKITLLIFLSAIGLLTLFGLVVARPILPPPPPSYYLHRQTKVHHDLWGQCKWVLTNDVKVYYRLESGEDITSFWYSGVNHVYETSVWTTYGYSNSITYEIDNEGYYTWVQQKNWAYFETLDGVTKFKVYAECKIHDFYGFDQDVDWDGWWVQYYGFFTWIFKSNVLIAVN